MAGLKVRQQYDQANAASARLILASTARYGGDQALPVQWARRVIARLNDQGSTNGSGGGLTQGTTRR